MSELTPGWHMRNAVAEQRVDDGASDGTVAVGERVDRLELGMDERSVDESLNVITASECTMSVIAVGMRSRWGGMNIAPCGP